jgi:hypothetical protein
MAFDSTPEMNKIIFLSDLFQNFIIIKHD